MQILKVYKSDLMTEWAVSDEAGLAYEVSIKAHSTKADASLTLFDSDTIV